MKTTAGFQRVWSWPVVTGTHRVGRVENGLDRELATRDDVKAAERAALRAQARAVDMAEKAADPDAVSRANAVYLQLREAAALSVAGSKPADPWADLMAEITRPGAAPSDTANT